jgi:hypothetical protein
MARAPAPTITPLDHQAELAARLALTEAMMNAYWHATGWQASERLAIDLLDRLKADGLELVKVDWP